jgi:hypothetical protein
MGWIVWNGRISSRRTDLEMISLIQSAEAWFLEFSDG